MPGRHGVRKHGRWAAPLQAHEPCKPDAEVRESAGARYGRQGYRAMSESGTTETESPSELGTPLRIFIKYRRDDTVGWALPAP